MAERGCPTVRLLGVPDQKNGLSARETEHDLDHLGVTGMMRQVIEKNLAKICLGNVRVASCGR